MGKYIHNTSGVIKTYQGIQIDVNSVYKIPPMLYGEFSDIDSLREDILNSVVKISTDGVNTIETPKNALYLLDVYKYKISLAVDKENINQNISGTDPTVICSNRVLWDLHEDYDITTDDFVVPLDGVYNFDIQMKITNLSNVASVELAIYKRGNPDDYWFILDKQEVGSLTSVQLSGATTFDFYEDERYTLKIILTKVLPLISCSCVIDGSDDYTAWGYSMVSPL